MIIKCKMCGGDIELSADKTIGTCEYCGCIMTLPKIDDEQRAAAFNRGNHFRRIGEFDKALSVYERIIQEDDTDAEAHWCCALCRFGIEYVEDPATFEWIPTCHRASFDSFLEDVDYLAAVEHSEGITQRQYKKEAIRIAEIQKGILATSQNEEPYDVFICYKESDDNGERTRDSIMAQDIYYQLTQEGLRVFFSRITLEDKAGSEYEPYIFAALNSARVMVVVGTKPEHFNAVWVKNEWSRFLALMRKDRKRVLLPCYRDIDPYDLPEQLSVLQSYDMAKIGFIQDLIRGIKKITGEAESKQIEKETVVIQNTGGNNVSALLKRGSMALEDHEWDKAQGFFEDVLNQDAECAEAFFGELLAKEQKSNAEDLFASWKNKYSYAETQELEACPENSAHISQMVSQYSLGKYLTDSTIRSEYDFNRQYSSSLASRNRQKSQQENELKSERLLTRACSFAKGDIKTLIDNGLESIYKELDDRIQAAKDADDKSIAEIAEAYEKHIEMADKAVLGRYEKAKEQQEKDYVMAVSAMEEATTISQFAHAKMRLINLEGYKDSEELAKQCQDRIDQIVEGERQEKERLEAEQKQEEDRKAEERRKEEERQAEIRRKEAENKEKQKKRIGIIVASVAAVCIVAALIVTQILIPNSKYNNAVELMESGDYQTAIQAFEEMNGYKDSTNRIVEVHNREKYDSAVAKMEAGEYEEAISLFRELDTFSDSMQKIEECNESWNSSRYKNATDLMDKGNYEEAILLFQELESYKDSMQKMDSCKELLREAQYNSATELMNSGEYKKAENIFNRLGDYMDSPQKAKECLDTQNENDYTLALEKMENKDYEEALTIFLELEDYADSQKYAEECSNEVKYQSILSSLRSKSYSGLKSEVNELGDYKDSLKILEELNNYNKVLKIYETWETDGVNYKGIEYFSAANELIENGEYVELPDEIEDFFGFFGPFIGTWMYSAGDPQVLSYTGKDSSGHRSIQDIEIKYTIRNGESMETGSSIKVFLDDGMWGVSSKPDYEARTFTESSYVGGNFVFSIKDKNTLLVDFYGKSGMPEHVTVEYTRVD